MPAADTRPARDRGLDPERCLSLTVRGHWGHFRRIDGNAAKRTYRVMPRTTVAGLFSAVLGLERNSYYDLFAPDASALAIEPVAPLRTMNMPQNTLSTDAEGVVTLNGRGKGIRITYPEATKKNRQQHNYEVLVEPAYRIDAWLADDATYDRLKETLAAGRSHYVPSLGLSEHLATIEYHGECAVTDADATVATSAVPGGSAALIPAAGVRYGTERSPGFMATETTAAGRRQRTTTGFIDWAYSDDALDVADTPVSQVDGRNVVFV